MDKAASAGHSDRCRIVVDTCCDFLSLIHI